MAPTDRQQQDPMKTEKAQEAVSSGRNKEKKNQSPPPWQAVPLQEEFTGSNPAPFGSQGQGLSLVPISALLYKSPSPAEPPQPTYTIRIRQQPEAARACGFGASDRRVIDPPPILELDIDAPNTTPGELKALTRTLLPIVHCTLWDPVNNKDATIMPRTTDMRRQYRLIGTLVASSFVEDDNGIEGYFFCFPDLSVRTLGNYSLKFRLFIVDQSLMGPGNVALLRSTTTSRPFDVKDAKDFPGMKASTELTKRLNHQGCSIPVKKGNAKSKDDKADILMQ